jgi:phage terminase large subunit GpA-like protein
MQGDSGRPDISSSGEPKRIPSSVNTEQMYAEWADLWEAPKRPSLSAWAEKHFYTSSEYAGGKALLRLHPYQREPFDCFTDPRVSDIVVKSGTQMLKTILMQVALAYVAIEDPGPCLLSQYKEADAEAFSKERLAPMIRDNPGLQRIPTLSTKSRKSGSTATYKEFPGGSWSLVGAGTAGNAARRTIRYYFGDEINKYELTKEGPFTELAAERTAPFRTLAKRVYCCSPTTPDGLISRKYEESDQRQPWVPCHECGTLQVLRWTQVRWDADLPIEDRAASARYQCENEECGARWTDAQRRVNLEGLIWIARKPFRGIAGFGDLGHLCSPYKTLSGMCQKWLQISADKSAVAAEDRRAFINTNLAEEYVEKGDAPEWQRLYDRREYYSLHLIPMRGLFLTSGADVQADRIEVSVYAWGRRKESWLVDHVVLEGDTSRPEVWAKLDDLIERTYHHESGIELLISKLAIDSGYATQEVYDWARKHSHQRVFVVKGADHGPMIGQPKLMDVNYAGRRITNGIALRMVNTFELKDQFYRWLKLDRPTEESGEPYPAGYCHYPEMNEEFFRQLTAEQLMRRVVKFTPTFVWEKTRERNEALDCRNYARAVASLCGLDSPVEEVWRRHEAPIADAVRESEAEPAKEMLARYIPPQVRRPLKIQLGGF